MDWEDILDEPKTIRVVTKLPDEDAKEEMMENGYFTISGFCKGLIDIAPLPTDESVTIICNDEFLLNGMKPNIVTPETEGVICGPIVICGYDPETGDSVSLTDRQVKEALDYCQRNNLHGMSLEGAYRYSKAIGPLQRSYDALNRGMEAY